MNGSATVVGLRAIQGKGAAGRRKKDGHFHG
jgi:hypothetical protein